MYILHIIAFVVVFSLCCGLRDGLDTSVHCSHCCISDVRHLPVVLTAVSAVLPNPDDGLSSAVLRWVHEKKKEAA